MNDIFETRNIGYSLRSQTDFSQQSVNTESFGINSLKYLASKVWNIVPADLKSLSNLNSFKKKIRKWEPKECHCKLCKTYIHNVGYVNIT